MALNYLLSPEFQIVNTAGRPNTGGYLEVFVSGSRERYYCASDFNGTLWPFQVPLDSLGSNVVLADDSQAYDVYIYNRYGGELMSRYNVHPGAGGGIGIGNITSSDGSIIVTQTANGVDLRTNSTPPSILRATADTLYMDGQFTFAEAQRDGQNAIVDAQGKVIVNEGWWHYDATVKLRWTGPEQNETQSVSLYTQNASDSMTFDLSYAHNETVQVSGEFKALNDSTQFVLGITGVPSSMVVELVDFGIHSIIGEGAGGSYDAGTGIVINEADRIISIDPDVVQGKLTAGDGITIDSEDNTIAVDFEDVQGKLTAGSNIVIDPQTNTISATAEPQQQADWTESDSTAVDYIKNKPDLSVYATQTDLSSGLATKQDVISDLVTIRAGAAAGATAVQDADYVHTDNNFTNADVTKLSGIATGAEVNVQANWTESDSSSDSYIQNKPTTKHLVAGANVTITDSNNNITISASTPSVPVQDVQVGGTSVVNAQGVAEVPRQVNADWNSSAGASEILNKPNLATVATSGDYNDLSNKPTIPAALSAGNGIDLTNNVITAKVDGTTVTINADGELQSSPAITVDQSYDPTSTNPQSGTAVAGALSTLNIPTATSDLTNDSGFITLSDVPAQVNADWNAVSGAAEILNKPTIPSGSDLVPPYSLPTDEGKVLTVGPSTTYWSTPSAGTVTDVEVNGTSVVNAQGVAEVTVPAQVQSDWTESDTTDPAYIANKPNLATVATSGSYADLSNTPSIPTATSDLQNDSGFITASDVPSNQVQPDWNESDTSDPAYIQNKPTIPVLPTMKELVAGTNIAIAEGQNTVTISATAAPQVQADWSESDTSDVSYIQHKPDLSVYALSANLATVATSGDYADLTNKPTVPTTDQQYNPNSTNPQSGTAVAEAIAGTGQVPTVTSSDNDKVLTATYSGGVGSFAWQTPSTTQVQADWTEADSTDPSYIQNKPNLATVATTGDYADLTNKPTIPAAQVNSDWSANSGVAQILHKPTVKPVLAGSNITITETANDFTIAASVPVIGTITV